MCNNFSHLVPLGWDEELQHYYTTFAHTKGTPARVSSVRRKAFQVTDGTRKWLVTPCGSLLYRDDGLYPAAGDWVSVTDSTITDVFPRKNALSRGASGRAAGSYANGEGTATQEQLIAANIDTVFIVCGLDNDFNLRRIERYITLVYNCGLSPVVILTKADEHEAPQQCADDVEAIAFGVPVHLVGLDDEACLESLETYLTKGKTVTMIGSSGAGKSTLLNRLAAAEIQQTGIISQSVGKGKHTTTTRDLILLPQGGVIIDNPGIREVALWDSGDGIEKTFPDIMEYAEGCRFSDCSHTSEPGCQVLAAVASGELANERLENFYKMKRELDYLTDRQQMSADRLEKKRWKGIALRIKDVKKKSRKR